MATPANAPYKLAQQAARNNSQARVVFASTIYHRDQAGNVIGKRVSAASAVRDGKINKKSGRRLATSYK